jgi:transcriptional regulator with XRE-family HTH domain
MAIITNPDPGVTLEFTLGDRLRKARQYANMEIQELASAVDVHRQSVARYETDQAVPKRGTMLLWSMATGVSFSWLIGESGATYVEQTTRPTDYEYLTN